jgi:nucleolar complex protein 3
LLSAALQGIGRFAHMVNIDFFRDLLAVLRDIMVRTCEVDDEDTEVPTIDQEERLRLQILCVLTAFELLTGQGV